MRDRAATSLLTADVIARRVRLVARRALAAWWRWVTTPRPDPWADEPVAIAPEVPAPDGVFSLPFEPTIRLEDGNVVLRWRHTESTLRHEYELSPSLARNLGRSLVAAAEELEVPEVRS